MVNYKGVESKWELNAAEKALIRHCQEKGFEIIKFKQFMSKSKFEIKISEKITLKWEILSGSKFSEKFFDDSVELRFKVEELQSKLNDK